MIFAGIDGGQSGARVVLADEGGRILARASGPALFARENDARALVAGLSNLVRAARAAAGESADDPIAALVAGVSGQDEFARLPSEAFGARSAKAVHDSESAHAGALAGYHGIVVTAGSGSVAFGTDVLGRHARRGGWGATFGDEGGAFWIGRRGVSAAMRAADAGIATRLGPAACEAFGVPSLRAIARAVLRGEVPAQTIGEFAPRVLELAASADGVANEVLRAAAAALVTLVTELDRTLEPQSGRAVSWAGKVFNDVGLQEAWRAGVEASLDRPRVFAPRAQPVVGALALAYREAGRPIPATLFSMAAE